jgi:predicted nuclease with TOPRIM domain
MGQLTVKDEYIKDLEEQNDDFRGEMENIGLETFI